MYQFNWNLETYHSCYSQLHTGDSHLTAAGIWVAVIWQIKVAYTLFVHVCIEQDKKFHRNWCNRFPVKSTETHIRERYQQTRINWNKTCFNFSCVWNLDVYKTHTIISNLFAPNRKHKYYPFSAPKSVWETIRKCKRCLFSTGCVLVLRCSQKLNWLHKPK